MKIALNTGYGCIHGSYWATYGIITSFASVLLLARGYNNSDIGLIFAVGNVAAVILQPVLADIADRSKRISTLGVMQCAGLILMVLTAGLFALTKKTLALTLVYVLLIGWDIALQPLINSLTFKLAESGIHINFGMTRSVGSLVYSLICGVLGMMVEKRGIAILPITGEVFLLLFMISLMVVGLQFRRACRKREEKQQVGDLRDEAIQHATENTVEEEEINLPTFVRRNKLFFVMNLGVLGVFFTNSTLNNFMLQIITPLGGDSADMGQIFSLLAILEIPMLVVFDRVSRRFSCQFLLKVASITYGVKILITWFAPSVQVVLLSQLTQLTSFALFLPAMVKFIDQLMCKGEAVKGQALYTTMGTVAAVLSSVLGGFILDHSGAKALLATSFTFTAVGIVIIFATVDKISGNRKE